MRLSCLLYAIVAFLEKHFIDLVCNTGNRISAVELRAITSSFAVLLYVSYSILWILVPEKYEIQGFNGFIFFFLTGKI